MFVKNKNVQERIAFRQPWFRFKNGKFHIESLDYSALAKKYGTPLVCFSKNRLLDNARTMLCTFQRYYKKTKIFYAYKANYFQPILSDLKEFLGAEVISELELELAQRTGIPSEDIIFNGVGKTVKELEACVKNNILVNVDSISEIDKLDYLASRQKKIVNVGLRIHPELKGCEKTAFIQKGSKLGLDVNHEAITAVSKILKKKHLHLKGLHAHAYSRQTTPQMHLRTLDSMIDFSKKIEKNFNIGLEFFDIGGGFDTRAVLERTSSLDYLAKQISQKMRTLGKNIFLYLEPGRYVVNDAGVVISKIMTKKTNSGRTWLITDVATNFLIPTKNANFEIIPAEIKGKKEEKASFGGGICSSADVIKENVVLPKFEEGEDVVILNSGAYTAVMVEEFVYPRPQAIYVDKKRVREIWKRECIDDAVKYYWGMK